MGSVRLDVFLTELGFAPTREKAKALIMAGEVLLNGQIVIKAGLLVSKKEKIEIKQPLPFVSRGGLKLKKALEVFQCDPKNWICCDIGAAHGGFTDCLLQAGAKKVYAIDVGLPCLDYKLILDQRVCYWPKQNFRYFDLAQIPEEVDFVSIDVSFISLKLLFPKIYTLLRPQGFLIALVKPQFEAKRKDIQKGGVVKDPAIQEQILTQVAESAKLVGLIPQNSCLSPVVGKKSGNKEFLLFCQKVETK